MPILEPAEERELLRRVQARVRHWRHRVDENDYQDMLSEAYLKAWQSYCHGIEQGVAVPLDYAMHYAAMGPLNWLRDWYGERRHGAAKPEDVPWETVGEETLAAADPRPSPEAIALERIERHALWNWLRRTTTPRQLEALALMYRAGLNGEEITRRLGMTPNAFWNRHNLAIANSQIAPEHLPSFAKPGTSYPRCRRGHYLTPENIGRTETRGNLTRCCLLCQRAKINRSRARRKAPAGQQTAPGPSDGSECPSHPKAARGPS